MVAKSTTQPYVFYLPDLGEGLEEAELIEWSVQVGQKVQENDILAKMETAKALVEVPSPHTGVIGTLHGQPGQAIKVGSPLVTFKDEAMDSPAVQESAPGPEADQETPPPSRPDAGSVVGSLQETPGAAAEEGKVLAAPAVRRLARELGVDLSQLSGTGIGGRVTAQDVQQAAAAPGDREGEAPAEPPSPARIPAQQELRPPAQHVSPPTNGKSERIPFRGVRKVIAEHLRHSMTHAVHYTVMDEADVTALDHLRRRLMAASNEKITLLPFVASAVCRVLAGRLGNRFNRLNSTVDDEHQEIIQHKAVHLGVATDTEEGLMVPVIRDADHLGVLELSRQIADLAKRARDRSIPRDQLHGSTFTISNFGSLAGRFGTPIINYPEAGILGIGRAREDVVVRNGMIGVGKLLPLSLSADHRVIDGATAAAALAKVIELLQAPEELLPPGGQERG